ncbi:sterol 3beta-glucosyltransferase [Sporothrix brasiliensis 5110]|uniref:Sterol 3-beta-glucosyltransferase n=1 Tax=Sporothrix brasiliensis 5110 TaxID=1398154 RepID=A0A0C2J8N9_9PEZI|nr:sterol 3beta-glucosyltransferase [Sporothrix brasiliensis 5110]KIH93347.1 sterol 3beta-glucosyltransferase [Sporothrix brasiliensis 5110]
MPPPRDPAAPTAASSTTPTPTPTQTPPLSTAPSSDASNRNTNTDTTTSSTATLQATPGPSRTVTDTASPTTPSTNRNDHQRKSHSHSLRLPSRVSAQSPSTSALASALASSPTRLSNTSPRQSEDDAGRHKPKKLVKRRHDGGSQRTPKAMDFPERLKQSEDGGEEEVIRPVVSGNGAFYNMNQSVFNMLAAAGSNIDFNNRFGDHSSEEDDDDGGDAEGGDGDAAQRRHFGSDGAAMTVLPAAGSHKKSGKKPAKDVSQSTIFTRNTSSSSTGKDGKDGKDGERRSRFSDSRLMRSLPSLKQKLSSSKRRSSSGLSSKSSKHASAGGTGGSRILEEDEDADAEAESSHTPSSTQTRLPRGSGATSDVDVAVGSARGSNHSPSIQVTRAERSNSVRSIPVMSRMLEAKELASLRPSFDIDRDRKAGDKDKGDVVDAEDGGPSALSRKLMEIFEFDKPEEVIEEYPCWLLQSVLLQGYMYITSRHICFYAYLPKKANEVAKSGYLAKSGKRNPKYNRYWFRLKGDVFSYYRDAKNLYFPHGQIDLRYGISATVSDQDKDGVHFQVVTHHRTYFFRADSAASAKEWVKSLQRVIFRSHNDGDSVKISLPIENVIDIEENQAMVEFTETCKIRVIDNDETFAIDEYFFSFFDYGKDAVRVLKILIDANNVNSNSNNNADSDNQSGQGTPSRAYGRRLDLPSAGQGMDDRVSQDSTGSVAFGAGQERMSMSKPPSKLQDSVRATLLSIPPTAASSPRASGEIPRTSFDALRSSFSPTRRSLDTSQVLRANPPRRSFSDRIKGASGEKVQRKVSLRSTSAAQPQSSDPQDSTDSFMQSSVEDPSQISFSNMAASSSDDPSASQILHGSDVFQSPTVDAGSPHSAGPPPSTSRPAAAAAAAAAKPLPRHSATTGDIRKFKGAASDEVGDNEEGLAQNLARLGTYPLQRAGAYAGWLNRQSRRMSTMLATESMGYVEKVSGMWKGGRQHYDDASLTPHADAGIPDGEPGMSVADAIVSNEHFREHFALPDTEKLEATYFGSIMRVLPLYGKIYVSQRYFCFRSLVPGTRTKLILPLKDIENVVKEKGFRYTYAGLVVVIRGHEELFFEFHQAELRDDCAITLLHLLDRFRSAKESGVLSDQDKAEADVALAERDALKEAREEAAARMDDHAETPAESTAAAVATAKAVAASSEAKAERLNRKILRQSALMSEAPTILFDDPKASFLNFKPAKPLRITCLTIGSRGDVQPYIALGRGLLAEGHHVRIATHPEFEGWIRSHGLDYGRVAGDPGELMRICIENGTFTIQFLREANSKMRTWLDELLSTAWTACQGADLLIESPSAMAGIHIAEKLQIPYFRAFTMPWTRTRAYPHAFLMPERRMGGAYNQFSYAMFENIFWRATAGQVNRWRNKTLGLRNTSLEKLQINKVPFLYNFSPCVVPPPLDYSDWIRVTGYWFLDEGTNIKKANNNSSSEPEGNEVAEAKEPAWTPPQDLLDFIAKARKDRKKIVYVGFGSIVVADPAKMTQEVIDAVHKADVRCILSKGWSDRLVAKKDDKTEAAAEAEAEAATGLVLHADPPEDVLPAEIFPIKSAPHDWLFAQIDAAAHHGGSGTTGASLRAGIPTIIRPFFGDQFFFGMRVEDLGVGLCLKKWGAMSFARALWEATNSERMIRKAAVLGEQIREENGVDTAIQSIYRDMEYAKSLVREKAVKSGMLRSGGGTERADRGHGKNDNNTDSDEEAYNDDDDDDDEPEESWTFVGDDDPMQQSVILTPDAGRASGDDGVVQPASSGAGGSSGSGGYKALGSRILGIATAQKQ